jgi:hypothetical protein
MEESVCDVARGAEGEWMRRTGWPAADAINFIPLTEPWYRDSPPRASSLALGRKLSLRRVAKDVAQK